MNGPDHKFNAKSGYVYEAKEEEEEDDDYKKRKSVTPMEKSPTP
jgi:hypothetical protein